MYLVYFFQMADIIEILSDDDEVVTFDCKFCQEKFSAEHDRNVHLCLKHFKDEIRPDVENFFPVRWECHVCSVEVRNAKEALVHVGLFHKKLKVAMKNSKGKMKARNQQQFSSKAKQQSKSSRGKKQVAQEDDDDEIQELQVCSNCKEFKTDILTVNGKDFCSGCISNLGSGRKSTTKKIHEIINRTNKLDVKMKNNTVNDYLVKRQPKIPIKRVKIPAGSDDDDDISVEPIKKPSEKKEPVKIPLRQSSIDALPDSKEEKSPKEPETVKTKEKKVEITKEIETKNENKVGEDALDESFEEVVDSPFQVHEDTDDEQDQKEAVKVKNEVKNEIKTSEPVKNDESSERNEETLVKNEEELKKEPLKSDFKEDIESKDLKTIKNDTTETKDNIEILDKAKLDDSPKSASSEEVMPSSSGLQVGMRRMLTLLSQNTLSKIPKKSLILGVQKKV